MLTLVAAADLNGAIGQGNALPWRLPADLRRFKATTMGHAIVMGRRTFESMARALPGRLNIVLTRDATFAAAGVTVAHNLEEAIVLGGRHHPEVMVIGGAAVYGEALPRCDRMVLTIVAGRFRGDAWLPKVAAGEWVVTSRTQHEADADNPFATTVYDLVRKTPATQQLPPFTWPT